MTDQAITKSRLNNESKTRSFKFYSFMLLSSLLFQGVSANNGQLLTIDDGDRVDTTYFGRGGGRVVDGPITAVTCKGPNCSQLKLRTLVPDIDSINSNFFVGSGSWSSWFSDEGKGSASCTRGRLVSGIECRGPRCDEMRIRCSILSPEYSTINSFTSSTVFDGSTVNRKRALKCAEGHFLKGVSCKSRNCGRIRLDCVKVRVEPVTGTVCKDFVGWADSDGETCEFYKDDVLCEKYGDFYENAAGQTANDACCVCGGGSSGPGR